MTKIEELDNIFQLFQQRGLNCGGIWKIVEIEKNEFNPIECIKKEIGKIDFYKKYFKPQSDNLGLELIEIINWEDYFEERIEHWSNFELISKKEQKEEFVQEEYDKTKIKFKSLLNDYLNQNQLESVLKINENKFNNYKTNWGDQISEDFVFALKRKILIIHFGWSS